VEWAEALLLSAAGTFELYVVAYDIIDMAVLAYICDIFIANSAGHASILTTLRGAYLWESFLWSAYAPGSVRQAI
jgi:hypothetical protein